MCDKLCILYVYCFFRGGGVSRCFAVWILLLISVFAYAETPLLWNQPASRQHCPTGDDAVWVHYPEGNACMRYFSAGNLQAAPLAVVILKGDRVSQIKRPPATIPGNTAADQRRQARAILRQTGLPTIILARPGTYGSSGNHYHRRQAEEFQAIDAALNAIKARYGIQRFILSGHSGGATAASALWTSTARCSLPVPGEYSSGRSACKTVTLWHRHWIPPGCRIRGIPLTTSAGSPPIPSD